MESTEVNAIGRNHVERDALYSPEEKKQLKPTEECMIMYAKSNKQAKKVVEHLSVQGGRVMVPVDVTADALLDSVLYQVSHRKDKYKAFQLRKQICYYLAKYPEIFTPLVADYLKEEDSYESFILNFFHGLSLPVLDIVCAVLTKMWNITINVVTPKGVKKMYHEQENRHVDIVIVWNNVHGDHAHYSATKVDHPDWQPIRGVDWAGDVKPMHNVKNVANYAEKFFRKRTANKILEEYENVSDSILNLKSDLLDMHNEVELLKNQIDSISDKIKVWAGNVYKMEGRQGMLRAQLLSLGVNVEKISTRGSVVPEFHKISQDPTPKETLQIPTTQGV